MAATPFQVEAWAEFAIGLLILLGRIAYRSSLVGWNWQGDDYFAVAAFLFLTVRGHFCSVPPNCLDLYVPDKFLIVVMTSF